MKPMDEKRERLLRLLENQREPVPVLTAKPADVARCEAKDMPSATGADEPIAIIGVQGRYPASPTLDALWDNLKNGRSCIREVPPERWDWRAHDAARDPELGSYSRWGGFLDDVDRFDPLFFGISPREAECMDPQERLFLETAWALFEEAGLTRERLRKPDASVGVFVGAMNGHYAALAAAAAARGKFTGANSAYWSIANRVSYFFDLQGPSLAVDTACSSSLTALHLACESLRRGECRMAVAGAVNLVLHPLHFRCLSSVGMLARDERCKCFGEGADGFVDGEGVGAVLLKPLSAARRDGDRIRAVIRATAVNSGGRTSGYTVPNPNAQASLVAETLRKAGVEPGSISYVEAHGTGTALGDPIEIAGLTRAFGAEARAQAGERGILIGSVKSNLGHLESAAGLAGLTKVLLQLEHGMIAPTLHAATANPRIDFAATPFALAREAVAWERPLRKEADGRRVEWPRRAAVSSFGAGGANAHVILEEAPAEAERPTARGETPQVIVLSARDAERLRDVASRLRAWLETRPETGLAEVAATLQSGREAMRERVAWVAATTRQLRERLGEFLDGIGGGERWFAGRVAPGDVACVGGSEADRAELYAAFARGGQWERIAKAWVGGETIPWARLRAGSESEIGRREMAGLPTYPFARERYWIPGAQPAAGDMLPSGAVTMAVGSGVADASPGAQAGEAAAVLAFAAEWCEVIDACLPGARDGDERMLVISPNSEVVDAARAAGWTAVRAERGKAGELTAAVRAAADGSGAGLRVVWVEDRVGREDDAAMAAEGVTALLQALRGLVGNAPASVACVIAADARRAGLVEAAGVLGRSIRQIWPAVRWTHVTTDERGAENLLERARVELNASTVGDAVATEWRVRDGRRWLRSWRERAADGAPVFRRQGCYLITGGLGAIGLAVARYLANEYRARLVLTGRSALDAAKNRELQALGTLGGEAIYVMADACDESALVRATRQAREQFGALNGVIHAAGVTGGDAVFLDKDAETMATTLRPKISGALALDRATAGEALDVFLLFSSASGALGDFGQADYAAGNRFLDGFAEWRRGEMADGRRRGATVSIGWPLWREGGMHLRDEGEALYLKTAGLAYLETPAGLRALDCLSAGADASVLVLAGRPDRVRGIVDGLAARNVNAVVAPAPKEAWSGDVGITGGDMRGEVEKRVRAVAAAVIKLAPERLGVRENFGDVGFDSISLKTLAAALSRGFGVEVAPTVFFAKGTVAALTEWFVETQAGAVRAALADTGAAPKATAAPSVGIGDAPREPVQESGGDARGALAVAVIGMAGVFPGSEDVETFWRHLVAEHDLVTPVPAERGEWTLPGPDGTPVALRGGFVPDVDKFDARFFGISPREAECMDPQHRLFLQSAWSAIEDAAVRPSALAGRKVGVFVGAQFNDYQQLLARSADYRPQMATGNAHSMLANRVSYALNLRGPSESIDTACSSALVAVHRAVSALRAGECELALAGGVSLILTPGGMVGGQALGVLSADGRCKTFDAAADGYVRGEGVGAFLLKPLAAAERDGDPIHAVIRGTGVNHGGRAHSLTAPNPDAQAELLAEVWTEAGYTPGSIGLLEAHGTGTELGDPVEVEGISTALRLLADKTGERLPADKRCALGAVKTNIGHLEPAAGVAGLAKVVRAVRDGVRPGTLHQRVRNPYLKLEGGPLYVVDRTESWTRARDAAGRETPRRAGVSSFGFGGANAHIAVEEYVASGKSGAQASEGTTLGGTRVFVLSARTPERLQANAQRLRSFLGEGETTTGVGELCHAKDIVAEALGLSATEVDEAIPAGELGLDRVGLARVNERLGSENELRAEQTLAEWAAAGGHTVADDTGAVDLSALACTLQVGRDAMEARVAILASSVAELRTRLDEFQAAGGVVTGGVLGADAADDAKLVTLARRWAAGEEIDWAAREGGAGFRLHAPTYPFAKDRHWIETPTSDTAKSAETHAATRRHPMGVEDISTGETRRFRAVLSATDFYVADHRVQDRLILPGTGHLELARAVGERALGTAVRAIREVMWLRPLVVDDAPVEVWVTLSPAVDGWREFEIAAAGGAPVFSRGLLSGEAAEAGERPARVDIDAMRGRLNAVGDSAAAYTFLAGQGLHYGPSFRAVRGFFGGPDESLARLEIAVERRGDFEPQVMFGLHPSLFDAALHSGVVGLAGQAGAGGAGAPALPFSLGKLRWHGALTPDAWAWVRATGREGHRVLDVVITDGRGEVLVTLEALAGRRLAPAGETAEPARSMPISFWAERWVETPETVAREERPENVDTDTRWTIRWDEATGLEALRARLAALDTDRLAALESVTLVAREASPGLEAAAALGRSLRALAPGLQVTALVSEDGATMTDAGRSPVTRCVRRASGRRDELRFVAWPGEADGGVRLRDEGVYVLAGGAGGLGRMLARHLASTRRARLVLAGRREANAETEALLAELRALGGEAIYVSADVAREQDARRLMAEARMRFGAINGVVQLAGGGDARGFAEKSAADFSATLAPKAAGTMALDAALAEAGARPDFFCVFASTSAVAGDFGQGDYAAANRWAAAWARGRGDARGATRVIYWPLWREGGMGFGAEREAEYLRVSGLRYLETAEGLAAWERILAGADTHVAVVAGEPVRVRAMLGVRENIATEPPGDPTSGVDAAAWLGELERDFTEVVAGLLKMPVGEIGPGREMSGYGLDSILIAELTRLVNRRYGVSLAPTFFFEHTTVRTMARELAEREAEKMRARFGAATSGMAVAARPLALAKVEATKSAQPGIAVQSNASGAGEKPALDDAVAVIGMSGRYPMARDLETFWANLRAGKNCVTEIPAERWRAEAGADGAPPRGRWGGFIDGVDEFDPRLFDLAPAQAELMDPMQRLFLQATWEALEDAGVRAERLGGERRRVGVFVGAMYLNYPALASDAVSRGLLALDSYSIIANRVSYFFNFRGPSIALDTACSASLTALHLACESLRRGECAAAVAGGVNLSLLADKFDGLGFVRLLGSTPESRSFGMADGMVPGEGAGCVILKPLAAAERDGDRILGVIRASAANHGGRTPTGYTAPNLAAQAELFAETIARANVEPGSIGYVECAANGSALGDPIEVRALAKAWKLSGASVARGGAGGCVLGSVKANVGHLEAASGVAQLTKVLLQMRAGELPPSIHCEPRNPNLGLEGTPFRLTTQRETWAPDASGGATPRRALVNSFGAGGANACLLVEAYQEADVAAAPKEGGREILVVSGRTAEALTENARRLLAWIETHGAGGARESLARVAWTLQTGREPLEKRLAFVAGSLSEAAEKLGDFLAGRTGGVAAGAVDRGVVDLFDAEMVALLVRERRLEKLAQAWVRGVEVAWETLHAGVRPRPVSLPTYAFARERYWVAKAPRQGAQPAVAAERESSPEPTVIVPAGDELGDLAGLLGELLKLAPAEIDPDQVFARMGVDSILAVLWANRIRQRLGVTLEARDFVEQDTLRKLAARVRALGGAGRAGALPRAADAERFALSIEQAWHWNLRAWAKEDQSLLTIPLALRLRGRLDAEELRAALEVLVRRHESLRTGFEAEGDTVWQRVRETAEFAWNLTEAPALAEDARDDWLARRAEAAQARPFDLANGPLLRVELVRFSEADHGLALALHHLVGDLWSMGILLRETAELIEARRAGREASLPTPTHRYADFVAWETGWRASPEYARRQEDWRTRLAGAGDLSLMWPYDGPSVAGGDARAAALTRMLDEKLGARMVEYCAREGVTPFAFLFGHLQMLVHALTGAERVPTGVPHLNRDFAELEPVVGFFANIAVAWTECDARRGGREWVRAAAEDLRAAVRDYVPFSELAAEIRRSRERDNRAPLQLCATFARQDGEALPVEGLSSEMVTVGRRRLVFDWFATFTLGRDGRLGVTLEYLEGRFSARSIGRYLEQLERLIAATLAEPDRPVIETARTAGLSGPSRVRVAGTFALEPLEAPLRTLNEETGACVRASFAGYGQVLQELLASSATTDAPRVWFLRAEDFGEDEATRLRRVEELAETWAVARTRRAAAGEDLIVACASRVADGLARLRERVAAWPEATWVEVAGGEEAFDLESERIGGMPYSDAYYAELARTLVDHAVALRLPVLKVVAVDADQTLWRGVVGEDGVDGIAVDEPRRALRALLREWRSAGVLLCLCSKNDEADVWAALEHGGAGELRREDFAGWRINWGRKSENLRALAAELNLGLESFLFLDDSASECAEVAAACPEARVVRLPAEDAEAFSRVVDRLRAFGPRGVATAEDGRRAEFYAQGGHRENARRAAGSFKEFVAGLELVVEMRPAATDELGRLAQLTQRTNQFNLTTIRRTEAELAAWLAGKGRRGWSVRVRDRFGDYGLTGLLLVEVADAVWRVDTWLLSCRVLGRSVERWVAAALGREAQAARVATVEFRFVPTERNAPARLCLDGLVESVGERSRRDGAEFYSLAAARLAGVEPIAAEEADMAAGKQPAVEMASSSVVDGRWGRAMRVLCERCLCGEDIVAAGRLRSVGGGADAGTKILRTDTERRLARIWEDVLGVKNVGADAHFFAMGGQSLAATRVLARVEREWRMALSLAEIFERPVLADLAMRIDAEAARAGAPDAVAAEGEILASDATEGGLSFAQERMWFWEQLEPGGARNLVAGAVHLRGALDPERLARAWRATVARHAALRTSFAGGARGVTQHVQTEVGGELERWMAETFEAARAEAVARARRPFDLACAPLWRASLGTVGAEEFLLVLSLHHIVGDGWSIGVVLGDLAAAYAADDSTPGPQAGTRASYLDFAAWQRAEAARGAWTGQLEYWARQLAGAPEVLDLPTDRPRPAVSSGRGATFARSLAEETRRAVAKLAEREGATTFMVLTAGLYGWLRRWSGQRDIVLGSPVAGRTRPGLEALAGLLVNTLALRIAVEAEDASFAEVLRETRRVALEAYANQDAPFDQVVERVNPARRLSVTPLFQVMIGHQRPGAGEWRLGEARGEPLALDTGAAQFDLAFDFEETDAGLRVRVEYATDLFDSATVERGLAQWERLVRQAAEAPDTGLGGFDLRDELERAELAKEWSARRVEFTRETTLSVLLADRAAASPDTVVVVQGDEWLTARELDEAANRLARHLRAQGAGPGLRVGVMLESSPDLITSLLAVWKCGAAYVPVDPALPRARVDFLVKDADVAVLIVAALADYPAGGAWAAKPLALADERAAIAAQPSRALDATETRAPGPEDAAYVLYTSGSTGQPKGVVVPHRALVNHAGAIGRAYGLKTGERALQFASPSFDIFAEEVFPVLLAGATVVLMSRARPLEPAAFNAFARAASLNVLNLPTAYWHQLVEALPETGPFPESVRLLVVGGEQPSGAKLGVWRKQHPGVAWMNAYGPTEATVTTLIWSDTRAEAEAACTSELATPPLGRTIENTFAIVVDERGKPVPTGWPGELWLGGDCLANGYWRRPELTQKAFVANTLIPGAGARLYRTGDCVRRLADGSYVFHGRVDGQVKIRGFRIEPGEVEAVLAEHPKVAESAVLARKQGAGDARLEAWVVAAPGSGLRADAVRAWLAERMPAYLVPSLISAGDEPLPRTVTGKIDRRALAMRADAVTTDKAEPRRDAAEPRDATEPTDSLQHRVARIFAELLGRAEVGARADFFEHGGHSLLALELARGLRRELGADVPLAAIYQEPTIEAVARRVREGRGKSKDGASDGARHLWVSGEGGSQTPVFLVPGAGGSAVAMQALARALGPDRCVYTFHAPGLDDDGAPMASIPQLAAYYVALLREHLEKRLFVLGGWSMGGVVAFEMARQLEREGLRPVSLVLLDSYLGEDVARIEAAVASAADDATRERRDLAAALGGRSADGLGADARGRLLAVYRAQAAALAAYRPEGGIESGAVLMQPEAGPAEAVRAAASTRWQSLVGGPLAVVRLPGDHYSLLESPQAERVAERMFAAVEMV